MSAPDGLALAAERLRQDEARAVAASAPPPASLPILRTIVSLGIIQVLTMGFTLVRSKVVAVTLGPVGVGAISLIDQVAALVAQICTFSLPFAALKFLSTAHSESHEIYANLYVAFFRILLVISLAGTGAGIFLLFVWPSVLGRDLAVYGGITILAFLAIPATNLIALITNAIAAARRVQTSAVYGAVGAFLLAVLAGGGTLLGSLRGYYTGNLIAMIATVVGGMVYLYRSEKLRIHNRGVSLLQELRRYPNVTSFAASLYVISFTLPVAYLSARYAVLRSQGMEAAGLLQSAMAPALALFVVMRQPSAFFLTPILNRVGAPEDKFHQAMEYLQMFALIIGVIALPLVLFPDWWLYLLYSKRFLVAAPFVYIFVVGQAMELFAGVNLGLLVGLDHIGTQVWVTLCGLASLAAVAWWLVPHWGIAAVGIAILSDGLIVFGLSAWRLWVHHRLAAHRAMGWLPPSVLLLVGVCGAGAAWFTGNTPGRIAVKVALGVGLTLLALRVTRTRSGNLLQELMQRAGVN